jgi:hypothetical protein
MAKPKISAVPALDHPLDAPHTRLRAFLAKTRPLTGNEVPNVYWEGRSLIESLALSYETREYEAIGPDPEWTLEKCATVLAFLQVIEPVKGHCFCGGFDREEHGISITCGHHIILGNLEEQLLHLAARDRKRKRAA